MCRQGDRHTRYLTRHTRLGPLGKLRRPPIQDSRVDAGYNAGLMLVTMLILTLFATVSQIRNLALPHRLDLNPNSTKQDSILTRVSARVQVAIGFTILLWQGQVAFPIPFVRSVHPYASLTPHPYDREALGSGAAKGFGLWLGMPPSGNEEQLHGTPKTAGCRPLVTWNGDGLQRLCPSGGACFSLSAVWCNAE